MPSSRAVVPFLLALSSLPLPPLVRAQVPSPVEFLGHEVGADYKLCNYTDLVRYWQAIAAKSDRVRLVEIGETSYGQRMQMAVISSPANLARLERLREISTALAHPRNLGKQAMQELAAEGRAIVWIDAGLHATESIAGQNILELVWQMTSRDDDEVRRILDEVVLLACPVNPDGLELIANAYRATRSMSIPVLYQRYIGHDNNRDFYTCNQVEAQNVNRIFYREWCPQIVYNHHQTAPAGTIIFTPPFRDPHNYLVDPLVIRGIEIVSAHMNQRFAAEDKPGVISRTGAPYSGWWNGGLRSTNYFHNIIGILTESFGRPEPTPIRQTLDRRLPYGDYPDPVAAQTWHARQTIEYLQTANFAILDYAARHRRELLRDVWTMATRAIDRGRRDYWTPTPVLVEAARRRDDPDSVFRDPYLRDPRVFVLRSDQPDWSAAQRFVRALQRCGVEVQRANAQFAMNGATMPAGSFVVKTDQPYRAHVLDMFEPQWHPNDFKDGKPVAPYDAAGWTLAMQMDVRVERSFEAVDAVFETQRGFSGFVPAAAPSARGRGASAWALDPRDSHTVIAVNRLLAKDCRVAWSAAGGVYEVESTPPATEVLTAAAAELGVRVRDVPAGGGGTPVRPVRLGLFDTFGGHMPTGWDQWLLLDFGFPVQQVWGDRIEAGDLKKDFDVLVFHTGLPGPRDLERAARAREEPNFAELAKALPPFEDWSNLASRATRLTGEKALPAIRAFVEQGGTLIAMGSEVDKVIRHFQLPVKVGTYMQTEDGERRTLREEFYVPGSLLAIEVDTSHPIARGISRELAAMVDSGSAILEVTDEKARIDVVARYRGQDTLVSGWAIGQEHLVGKAAALCAHVGAGRIVLFGADVTYRGQPLGTFKLLFQAILSAGDVK